MTDARIFAGLMAFVLLVASGLTLVDSRNWQAAYALALAAALFALLCVFLCNVEIRKRDR